MRKAVFNVGADNDISEGNLVVCVDMGRKRNVYYVHVTPPADHDGHEEIVFKLTDEERSELLLALESVHTPGTVEDADV